MSSLAVERALRLVKSLPAREDEIRAKVLDQIRGSGIPEPDPIKVLVHQVGDIDQVKRDCEQMARNLNASVLICTPEAKILAYVWWT